MHQIEDALTILAEVTAQNALASDVVTTQRSAERLGTACAQTAARLGLVAGRGTLGAVQEHMHGVRAISQRQAMDLLVSAVGARPSPAAAAAPVAEMETHLAGIRQAGAGSRSIQNASALLDVQWLFLKHALQPDHTGGRQQQEYVARTSEIMFDVIDAELAGQRRQRGN